MIVVLANGCFDPLHWGHLQHLKQAKAMGDLLWVSVTQDIYVNKGSGRPVFGQEQRAEMLKALRIVNRVIIVPDLMTALFRTEPNILVKGAEYRGKIQKEHLDYCKKHGIKIRFTEGKVYSSTDLVRHFGFKQVTLPSSSLLTTYIIQREYLRTHEKSSTPDFDHILCRLNADNFPASDLALSLDEFSQKQGWMK